MMTKNTRSGICSSKKTRYNESGVYYGRRENDKTKFGSSINIKERTDYQKGLKTNTKLVESYTTMSMEDIKNTIPDELVETIILRCAYLPCITMTNVGMNSNGPFFFRSRKALLDVPIPTIVPFSLRHWFRCPHQNFANYWNGKEPNCVSHTPTTVLVLVTAFQTSWNHGKR